MYIDEQVQDHVDNPRDDLTGYLLNVEIDGNKLETDTCAARSSCC